MIELRKAGARGHANHGWLDSWHSFSFADYHDPEHMSFGALRVINDDTVAGAGGFSPHPHRDMEIISYVISGSLQHKDSMGNGSIIQEGDIQRMSAGSGVVHSEYNASNTDPVKFLQIWILPKEKGLTPSYQQIHVSEAVKKNQLRLIAAPNGGDGVLKIHQDVEVFAGIFERINIEHALDVDRRYYLHVVAGAAQINTQELKSGDALKLTRETSITIKADTRAEILLFNLN